MSRVAVVGVVVVLIAVTGLVAGTIFLGDDDPSGETTPTPTPERSPVKTTPDGSTATSDSMPEKTPPATSTSGDDRPRDEKGSEKGSGRSGSPGGGDGDQGSDGTATMNGEGGAVAA